MGDLIKGHMLCLCECLLLLGVYRGEYGVCLLMLLSLLQMVVVLLLLFILMPMS